MHALITTNAIAIMASAVLAVGLSAGVAQAQTKSATDHYLDKCAVCHGADGAGKTAKGRKLKLEDVRKTSLKITTEQMIEIVTKGKAPDMDAFAKDLTADQIKQVVEYYRSLAKK